MNWLPPSFEWPVGRADGVVSFQNGDHVVPLQPSDRIQIYDRNWRFLRGWYVDASGGIFSVAVSGPDRIDVFTAGRSKHYVFNKEGVLVSQSVYRGTLPSQGGTSIVVPTPIWLWVFSGPAYSFAAIVPGMLLMLFLQIRTGGSTKRPSPDSSAVLVR